MATKEAKEKNENEKVCDCAEKGCNCENKCDCGCGCGCGCGCKCSCCCGCKGKLFKLFALIIVFLAGIGCGCLLCCYNGCKSHHRMPAHIAMAKRAMHQPKNNVIVIRTDGDEVVPEVAKVEGNFRNLMNNTPETTAPEVAPVPAPEQAPAEAEVPAQVQAPAEAEVQAQPAEPAKPVEE